MEAQRLRYFNQCYESLVESFSMCGRYRLSRHAQVLRDHYGIETEVEWAPRYNIAPTDSVAAIRQDAERPRREFSRMQWGLIPHWAKEAGGAARMINARSETAHELPAFHDALRQRRCLIPADGFYEWQRRDGTRQPFCFSLADDRIFAFAGLWDRWRDLETCSILTTTPNRLVSDIHNRMPVILAPEHYDVWLDPGFHDVRSLREILVPYPADRMRRFVVSSRVNSVKNDDVSICEAVDRLSAEALQTLLFS